MKRKESIFTGLTRMVTPDEASGILELPYDMVWGYFHGRTPASLRCLLKRICRSNSVLMFPAIGEPTYSLTAVMTLTGKGRCWALSFIKRNRIRSWCTGTHYQYSKNDVDSAWIRESAYWNEWIPLQNVSCLYGLDIRTLLRHIANGRIRTISGNRELLVSHKDVKALWKTRDE